jgi:branched-chain amino acid transport system permease protein
MRFLFKTSYDQDIRLVKHGGQAFWYGLLLLALLAAPWWLESYGLAQLSLMLIYGVVGLGLMVLAGYTGQFSMGHGGLLGIGAYAQAVMTAHGWPFFLSIPAAGLLTAAVGVLFALPALRVKGVYLAIATLSIGFIIEEVLARWDSVTGGNAGKLVERPQAFGWQLESETAFYFLCLVTTVLSTLAVLNLLRSPTGRAFVAVRDSEVSAQCMGIHVARTKTLAFAVSALLTGIGGALYAHFITFLTPDSFGILHSIDLLLLVTIGGLGSVHGAFLGAIFLVAAPQLISQMKDVLPEHIGNAPGLKAAVYGLVLIGFVIFEPRGLYGRWLKVRTWLQLFPFYRRGLFARQKSYQKSERLR